MSETIQAPAPTVVEPGTFRRSETLPPDSGRSLSSALAEMQRRRVQTSSPPAPEPGQTPPASQAVADTRPPPPAHTPELPPPDATMGTPLPAPASQAAGTAPPEMVVQLQIDGALVPVTISELTKGYMRTHDYTVKTQQAANELKRAQQAQQAFANAKAILEQRLPAIIAQHQNEFAVPIDWEKLSREDPIGTSQKLARKAAYDQAVLEQQHLAQVTENEARAKKAQMHALGHDVLNRLIPGWSDLPTRAVIQGAMRQHAISMGWSPEEVDRAELLDPRDIYLCWKSMNYDRLMAQRVAPQPTGAPVLNGNGHRRPPGETANLSDLEERFQQTHTLADALAVAQARAAQSGRVAAPPRQTARYR